MLIKPNIREIVHKTQNVVRLNIFMGEHFHKQSRQGSGAATRKLQSKTYNFLERPTGRVGHGVSRIFQKYGRKHALLGPGTRDW